MYSHDPFVLAVQGLDIPFLEKQRPLNTTSFRGKAQLVAAAKDTNDGQQKHRSATATIEPASSPAMVSVGLPNPSPPCPEEGLQRYLEQPSTPAGAVFLGKSLYGLQLTEGPTPSNRNGGPGSNACGPVYACICCHKPRSRRHRPGFGAPRAKGPTQLPHFSQPSPPSKQKALVIGINGVGEPDYRLDHAVRDAKRFEACLKGPLGFDAEKIQVLTDENEVVSRREIFSKLRWLFEGTRCGDMRVLYISGHCSLTPVNNVVSLESEIGGAQSVPATVFKTHFDKLPEGSTVEVVLDCCYSAGLIKLPNIIEEMVSDSEPAVNVLHVSRGIPEAPGYQKNSKPHTQHPVISPSGREPIRISHGATKPPLSQGLRDGPRPDRDVATKANVTVWAACKKDEKAHESGKVDNGILTHAICSAIEHGKVERWQIWDQVVLNTKDENDPRFKEGSEVQHSQVLSSQDKKFKEKIMNARAFQWQAEQ